MKHQSFFSRLFASIALFVFGATILEAQWATAYYAGWQQGYNNTGYLPAQNVDYSAVTHIIHFALVPRADGTLDDQANSVTAFNANELITRAHTAGKKVLIGVGGWATDVAFRSATNSTNRAKFIDNIVNLMKTRGYDGVDIDWEILASSDASQYIAFIRELRTALNQITPRPLLMAATAWQPAIFAQVADQLDQINLMTYDLAGAWPGWVTWPNSPVYDGGYRFPSTGGAPPSANGMVDSFISAGIPASKLGIGIDFYGYIWSGGAGTPAGGATEPRQSWTTAPTVQANVPYSTIMKNYYQPQYYRYDAPTQSAYLSIDNAGSSNDRFITYDDETVIQKKFDYVRNKKIGGVIIWELGGGYRADLPAGQRDLLLQTVKQALGGSTPTLDTTPPTVSLTSPANGATVSGTVTLSADASDNVGVVGVQFKVNGSNVGSEQTASPYSMSLNTALLLNGMSTISVVARDAAGNTATASITVTVSNLSLDTSPPTVSMTAPSDGATVSSIVTLSANASDNVGVMGVQFKVNGVNVGSELTSAPYSTTWNSASVTNGSYTLSAVARDAAGNTTTASVSVTVSNSTSSPPASSSGMVVFEDALQSPWVNMSWGASVTFASTEQSQSGTASMKTTLTAAWGALSVHYGTWGTTGINPSSYTGLAFAAHGGLTGTALSVFFENDAGQPFPKVNLGTVAAGKWTDFTVPMSQLNPNGQVINRISIQDISGSTRTFYVDNLRLTGSVAAPSVPTLASPSNGATNVAVNPTLSWNASTSATSYGLQVSTSNTFSSLVVNQTGITEISRTLSGLANSTTYYWRVNATNSSGTSGWSSVSSFTTVAAQDATPPTVSFSAPANGSTVSGTTTITVNATDNVGVVGVQFKLNGTNLGAEITANPYSYSWNTTTVANGSYTLTAEARDAAGNKTSATVGVTVSNTSTLPPSGNLVVYQDAVSSPWIDASWNATITFQSGEQKYEGMSSIKVVQNAWGALRLHSGPWGNQVDVRTSSYSYFEVAVYGGAAGVSLGVFFENDLNQSFPSVKYIWIPVNTWKAVSLPISQLNPNNQVVHRIVLQDLSGRLRTFFVDQIRFVAATSALTKSEVETQSTDVAQVPGAFMLGQNYPNPFNPSTSIRYTLPEAAEVKLEVYNLVGQLVATLVNEQQGSGEYQVPFHASSLASGVYVYRMTARPLSGFGVPFVQTLRMTLTK